MKDYECPTAMANVARTIPEDEAEGDSSSASSMSSTGTIVPSCSNQRASVVVPWYNYFEQELFLEQNGISHHVYVTPPKVLSKDPLFVCHHGAGSSGLSFAVFAANVKARTPTAGLLSVDARGHGLTTSTVASANKDFSLATLSDDLVQVILLTQVKLGWPELPNMLFVGHSLGGAVVTDIAKKSSYGSKLVGFAVIDVVEGSAMEALKYMQAYIANRPASFPSIDFAVDWHVRNRTIRGLESARISVPSLIHELQPGKWTWITDLTMTQQYWENWFSGMSQNFLTGKAAKLLVLAGTDRLDKELMIGQMQGKFQLQVFPEAGHFVQEDSPEKTAEIMLEFWRRNDRGNLILPPKVDDLIKQGKKV